MKLKVMPGYLVRSAGALFASCVLAGTAYSHDPAVVPPLVPPVRTPSATADVHSGHAVAIRVEGITNPAGLNPLVIADAGALAAAGGNTSALQSNVSIAGGAMTVLRAGALSIGDSDDSISIAAVANFKAEFVTHEGEHFILEAECIEATADAGGSVAGRMSADACVKVRGFKINGQAIAVTGEANQKIVIGDCLFIINERLTVKDQTSADAMATGIHFFLCDCIEGWLARVDAGFTLAPCPPPGHRPDCKNPSSHDAKDCGKDRDRDKDNNKDKDNKGGKDRDNDKDKGGNDNKKDKGRG